MNNFQYFIKITRKDKKLTRDKIAIALDLSENTIQIIEEADVYTLLKSSQNLIKNQIRRYCEYLEINEKEIVSILNTIDILYYRKSKYDKNKTLHYINRLAIIIIIVIIIILTIKQVKSTIDTYSLNSQVSQSSIIYTPIE